MVTRRRYSKREKSAAVGLAIAVNPLAASEQTGIPRTTILGWLDKPEYDTLRQKTRDEMAEGFKVLAGLALRRLLKQIEADEVDPKDVAVAMGIATEKFLLLSGDATARTETRAWTDELSDHESETLGNLIRSELARRSDVDAAQVPVEGAAEAGTETT